MKKRLSQDEEFQIMKLVLDKFLYLGFGIMAFGLFKIITSGAEGLITGFAFIFGGAAILILFLILIIKEYEIIR